MQTVYYRNIRQPELQKLSKTQKGCWLHVTSPDRDELQSLVAEYGFDPDLLDDGVDLYESPRLERENGYTYLYIRYCHPESVETSTEPLLIVLTPEMLVTVARRDPEPLQQLLSGHNIVTTQKIKTVLQVLESVNKGYRSHLNMVTKQVFASRTRLQKTIINNDDVISFIDTEEDLNEFLAALQPYGILLQALLNGRYLTLHEEDRDLIEDLELSTNELIELTKSRLKTIQNIREAYTTIATNNLNKIFKRLTSIAIFMAIPTVVGGIYGMNIGLPLENHPQAFWIIVVSTSALISIFVYIFHRRRWL